MTKYWGNGVYGGIAIGRVSLYGKRDVTVKRMHVNHTDKEKERFEKAKEETAKQLRQIYEKALVEVGETHAQIFDIHIMMLEDEDYNESILNMIEKQSVNAEYAVALTSDNFSDMLFAGAGGRC